MATRWNPQQVDGPVRGATNNSLCRGNSAPPPFQPSGDSVGGFPRTSTAEHSGARAGVGALVAGLGRRPNAKGTQPLAGRGRRVSLRQVPDFQEVAHEADMLLRKDTRPATDKEGRARVGSALAQAGRTWVSLQDAKREILRKPKLAPIKAERKQKRRGKPTISPCPHPCGPSKHPRSQPAPRALVFMAVLDAMRFCEPVFCLASLAAF